MELFARSLGWNLQRAMESGELRRQGDLDQAGDRFTEILPCDSLDLVELVMVIAEQKHTKVRTVGELIDLLDLLENRTSDNLSSPASRK
jgi:hypothetical protein